MATNQISKKGRIFLQVGTIRIFRGKTLEHLDDGKAPEGRLVIKTQINPRSLIYEKLLLAVYKKSELSEYDLKIIQKHRNFEATLEDGSKVEYVGFTYCHFFENLLLRKKALLEKKGMLDLFDGTIFGEVTKTILIPEEVIPAHNHELSVSWDDWNDQFQTDEDERGERYG